MALAGERIDYFNLALLDVHEAVRLLALLHHDRALGIRHYLPRRPQCLNMRVGKWCPYHLAQIFAYRLHAGSSGWITAHITRSDWSVTAAPRGLVGSLTTSPPAAAISRMR